MAAPASNILNRRVFTLADLPALEEARRAKENSHSQPTSGGFSSRIVTLGSLPKNDSDPANLIKSATVTMREATASLDALESRLHKRLDDFERELVAATAQNSGNSTLDRQLATFEEASRTYNESINRERHARERIADNEHRVTLRERNMAIELNDAKNCNYILITLLALAALAILVLLFC